MANYRNKSKANQKMSKNQSKTWRKRAQSMAKDDNYQDAFADMQKSKFPQNRVIPKANDPQWYFKDERILEDVASFSFSHPLGSDLHPNDVYSTAKNYVVTGGFNAVPGVLQLEIALTPGISKDAQSPINLAAQNVYSFVRYKNSGASNYDAPDLMMYLIGMDSLYSCWNWMKRIYGIASTYSQTNYYLPQAMLALDGVDWENIYAHLADFRAYLNMAANRISSFCVPATMTYMVRHSWMFSNIYADGDTTKSQIYQFSPSYFFAFQETASTKGGQLSAMNVLYSNPRYTISSDNFWNYDTLRGFMDNLINSLQYSEDIGIMSGDILKAYGEGNLFKLSLIDPDYKVEPVYSKEVLTQIENSHRVGLGSLTEYKITQDPNTNFIIFNPSGSLGNQFNKMHLNFHWNNPTPKEVMVATRLMAFSDGTHFTAMGSEVVAHEYMAYRGQYSFADWYQPYSPTGITSLQITDLNAEALVFSTMNTGLFGNLLKELLANIIFDWSPTVRLIYYDAESGGSITPEHPAYDTIPLKDYDNYTTIDSQDLEAMHLLALLTEFDVPR